jgi:hypothetical protein
MPGRVTCPPWLSPSQDRCLGGTFAMVEVVPPSASWDRDGKAGCLDRLLSASMSH